MIIKRLIGGRWVEQKIPNTKIIPPATSNEPDEWETKVECVTECSKAPKEIIVYFDPIVMAKVETLMKKYTSREWLGYLIGKPDKPHHILDLVIPVQTATSVHIDEVVFPQLEDGYKVIGVMHSHHNMGCGFSGTDDKWINQNHDISVLVTHSDMKIQVRVSVPCGAKKIMDAKAKINYNLDYDDAAFIKQAEENIRDKKYSSPTTYQGGDNWYHRYCGNEDDYFDGYYGIGRYNNEKRQPQPSLPLETAEKELSLEDELMKEFFENSDENTSTIL